MGVQERAGTDQHGANAARRKGREGGFDFSVAGYVIKGDLLADRLRGGLEIAPLRIGGGCARVYEGRDRRSLRDKLAQQFEALRGHHAGQEQHAGDVAPGPVEARNKAGPDRVAAAGEHDRRRRDVFRGQRCGVVGDDRRRAMAGQLGGQNRKAIRLVVGIASFDRHVPAFGESGFGQAFGERGHEMNPFGLRGTAQEPDHRHRLLCVRCKRPGSNRPCSRRATEQRHEFAPLHSITSSARASSVGGTVMPSALAVF